MLFAHYIHFFVGWTSGEKAILLPAYGLLWPLYDHGGFGVNIFWTISGLIFFWKYRIPVEGGRVTGWEFFVLRFSRLYPLHLLTLVAVLCLQFLYYRVCGQDFVYGNRDIFHFFLNVAFASGWGVEAGHSFNGPIWSVSAEVVIYALFFMLASRFGLGGWTVAITAVMLFGCYKLTPLKSVALAGIFFFAGGLCAGLSARLNSVRLSVVIPGLVVAGVAGTQLLLFFKLGKIATGGAICVSMSITLLALQFDRFGFSKWTTNIARQLGNLTYASYLVHFPIQLVFVIVTDSFAIPRENYSSPIMLLSWITVVLLFSFLTFKFLEVPSQRFIRKALIGR